jgi:signal transduction histidine kinase
MTRLRYGRRSRSESPIGVSVTVFRRDEIDLRRWRSSRDRHTVAGMNPSIRPAAAAAGRPGLQGPLPRWQRLLLPAMLGAVDADPTADGARQLPRSARDWAVDVILFVSAVMAAGIAVAIIQSHRSLGPPMLVLDALLAVAACLSLWVRRQYPAAVAWAAVAVSSVSNGAAVAALVALFSAGIHARPKQALQATCGAFAADALAAAIYTNGGGYKWPGLALWALGAVAALTLGSFVRVRRQLVLSLREQTRRLASEQQLRVRDAQLAERARIAREMHDVLAHRISLLSVHAGALEFNPGASHEEIARAAGVIRSSARAAQEELREVIGVLRADPEDETVQPPQPTMADLGKLIAESRQAGMDVTLVDELGNEPLPAVTGRTVYRVVQEALTNARKHAPVQPVSISIVGRPGTELQIEVSNRPAVGESRGRGATPPEHVGSGTGLVGIAERLALAGGTLQRQTLPSGGFRLGASVPWPLDDAREGEAP